MREDPKAVRALAVKACCLLASTVFTGNRIYTDRQRRARQDVLKKAATVLVVAKRRTVKKPPSASRGGR